MAYCRANRYLVIGVVELACQKITPKTNRKPLAGKSHTTQEYCEDILTIYKTTDHIHENEPAFNLSEVNLQSGTGWNRYRIIMVVRHDMLAEYWVDMGPRENFTTEQFRIPGGFLKDNKHIEIVHTVDELCDIADSFHNSPEVYDIPQRDLQQEYYNQLEFKNWLRKGKRVF